jgi:phosphohistidine phosphatase
MAGEKNLFIIRHGKSDWDRPGVSDIDRPLKERGIRDAHEMAKRGLEQGLVPDLIISSPANRALNTARIFSKVLGYSPDSILINQDLYLAESDEIMEVIAAADNSSNTLMLFGHNPGFTELTDDLSNLNIDNLPTTGMVLLKFKAESWEEISKKCLTSEFFDFPKNP